MEGPGLAETRFSSMFYLIFISNRLYSGRGWLELLLLLRLLLLLLMLLLLNLLLLLPLAGKPLNRDADHLLLLLQKTAILLMGAFSEKEKAPRCDGK